MAALPAEERWFQSRLSRPNANLTVLAGTDFANRIVAVFETAKEAKEAVDAHNARLNENGPAEAATSPSHGSNNSGQETAVNTQHDTTAPALPAMPDFEKAFFDLEELIDVVQRRVKTCEFVVDGIDGRSLIKDPHAPVSVSPEERDALHSTARDASSAVDDLSRRFGSVVAQVVAGEHAMREARKAAQIETDDVSGHIAADPLLEKIVEFRALTDGGAFAVAGKPLQALERGQPLWRDLAFRAPPAQTAAGARAALNEALADIERGGSGPLAKSLVRSALAYLGSAHVW